MKYLVTLDITVEATSRNDAFEKVENILGSQTFCLYDAEAVEQLLAPDSLKAEENPATWVFEKGNIVPPAISG